MNVIPFDVTTLGRIKRLISIHFSLPILYDLSGGNFESFFAEAVGGNRETRKLLFDVTKGNIGWSLKTLQNKSEEKFEVVLKRCDVIKRDFAWQTDDAQAIGDAVLENLEEFMTKSRLSQEISESRLLAA